MHHCIIADFPTLDAEVAESPHLRQLLVDGWATLQELPSPIVIAQRVTNCAQHHRRHIVFHCLRTQFLPQDCFNAENAVKEKTGRLKIESFPAQYEPLLQSSSTLDTQPSTCASLRRCISSKHVLPCGPLATCTHRWVRAWQLSGSPALGRGSRPPPPPRRTLHIAAGSRTNKQGQDCRNVCRLRDRTHVHHIFERSTSKVRSAPSSFRTLGIT